MQMERRLLASSRKITNSLINEWPELSEEDDRAVLSALQSIFDKHSACLRTVKKAPKWAKSASTPPDALTAEEEKQKQTFKSCIVLGANRVMKGLETDTLSLVLMCGKAQPAVLKQAILSLVVSRQCPAACVSHLLTAVQKSWPNLTSLTVMGIKKSAATNDFTDLVQQVKTTIPQPEGDQTPQLTPADTTGTVQHKPANGNCTDSTEDDTGSAKLDPESGPDQWLSTKQGPTPKGVRPCFALSHQNNDTGKTKPETESVEESVVDPTKYYIYKHQSSLSKAFDGQDFLSFDKELSTDVFVDIRNGKVSQHRDEGECSIYGIAPPFCSAVQGGDGTNTCVSMQGTKRASEGSTYKGIRIKQAKRDLSTPKQIRKKEKRESKEKKKKMKMKKAKK